MASSTVPSTSSNEVPEQVPFFDLCALLEKVGSTSGTDKKKRIFKTFVDQWRDAHTRLHPTDAATTVSSSSLLLHSCKCS